MQSPNLAKKPIFFFNVRENGKLIPDEEGSILADLDAARLEAMRAAREMVANLVLTEKVIDGQSIEIMDENRMLQATVVLKDTIKFR